jgi:hypothetical protein
MSALPWIHHPGVQVLLNSLVDRLDRADAEGKPLVRGVKLDSTTFPALFKAKFEAERAELWGYTERLVSLGWIRLRLDRGAAGQPGYELRPRVDVLEEASIRAAVGRPTRVRGPAEVWRDAVYSVLDGSEEIRNIAARYRMDIPGRAASDIVGRLNQLKALQDEPLLLREVSARLFWGASKVLDNRGSLVAALLSLEECPFPEVPIQLQVYLPEGGFDGVLFIENLATFEQALRGGNVRFARLALIFASGFKGSARRIRTENGATVFFAERGTLELTARTKLLSWLRTDDDMPCWFWGDLDYAGMEILRALRQPFPNTESWSAGYGPMLEDLNSGGGHEPDEAGKGAQRRVLQTGCEYSDRELLPSLNSTGRFVDQEMA